MELIGPYLAGAALLVVAGLAKVVRPEDTARALALLVGRPLRALRAAVRIGAVAEVVVGVVALVLPRTVPASLVAASYAGFAVVTVVVRARGGPLASCGCFGTPDTPATRLHVVVDLGLAAAAGAVAASGSASGTLASVLARQPGHGVPLVLVSAACAWLAFLALSRLSVLQGARTLVGATRGRWR